MLQQYYSSIFFSNEKTPFFVIGPFCTPHSIYLDIGFYGNDALSVLVLSTKKQCSSFLKKVFVIQKICYKVKVLKTIKISNECHIKHADLSNGE